MRSNRLKELFATGGTAVNAWLSANSPYQAEAFSHAGYDAVTVDLQHGMFGIDGAISLLQAVSAGPSMPMARTSTLDFAVIGKLLDAGAYGIICPSIDTAEQAARLVSYCRYPPTGIRSFGPSRGLLYGGPDYVEHADAEILVWAMVESATALADVDHIVATPGLDGIYVGPNDLALSLGVTPGLAVLPDVVEQALARILQATHDTGRLAGIYCADGAQARRLAELGWDLVTPGSDIALIKQAAASAIAEVRGVAHGAGPGGGY